MGKESRMVVVYTAYERVQRRLREPLDFSKEVKLTMDSFKDECDINVVVDRFLRGEGVPGDLPRGEYVDVSGFGDFLEHQSRVLEADRMFMALPGKTREKFGHSTARFLEVMAAAPFDDQAREFLKDVGVLKEDVPPKAVEKPTGDPPPA